jgi:hypothetical protein
MSTRGAVGWGNLEHYQAVYNHYDSYPDGLGQDVWKLLKEMGPQDFILALSKCRGWKDFLRGGTCPYCGQLAVPCSITGTLFAFDNNTDFQRALKKVGYEEALKVLPSYVRKDFINHTDPEKWIQYQKELRGEFWDKDRWVKGDAGDGSLINMNLGYREETMAGLMVAYSYKATGYPDPHLMFHGHAPQEATDPMTEVTSDKLFIEWVYIVDVEANMLHVLNNAQVGNKIRKGLKMIGPPHLLREGIGDKPGDAYAHWHVASVPLTADKLPKIKDAYRSR